LLEKAGLSDAPPMPGFVFCKEGAKAVLKIANVDRRERREGKKK
jgi:hypothetical protein